MSPIVPAGRPAVVVPGRQLLAGQQGCGQAPEYHAGSSRQWAPLADAVTDVTRTLEGCVQIEAGKSSTRPDGSSLRPAGSSLPGCGCCTCARWSSGPTRPSGPGKRPLG